MNKVLFAVIIMAIAIGACSEKGGKNKDQKKKKENKELTPAALTYDLEKPDRIWELKQKLQEISGIALTGNGKFLAIEDEHGILFEIDSVSGDISRELKFSGKGDFEDLALAGDTVWVLKTDGVLFRLTNIASGKPAVKEFPTPLNRDDDPEGMFYDAPNRRLLISCKDFSGPAGELRESRQVYAYYPGKAEFDEAPVYTVLPDEIKNATGHDVNYQPSAIAIHPLTKDIYILTSAGKHLVALKPNGDVLGSWPLSNPYFKQPEGLAFAANGDMFISNEGKGTMGNILLFRQQSNQQ